MRKEVLGNFSHELIKTRGLRHFLLCSHQSPRFVQSSKINTRGVYKEYNVRTCWLVVSRRWIWSCWLTDGFEVKTWPCFQVGGISVGDAAKRKIIRSIKPGLSDWGIFPRYWGKKWLLGQFFWGNKFVCGFYF